MSMLDNLENFLNLVFKPYFEHLNEVQVFCMKSYISEGLFESLNRLSNTMFGSTQQLTTARHPWGWMSQAVSKFQTETEYCALWCHHSRLDTLLRKNKAGSEMTPSARKLYWCDIHVDHQIWQKMFNPRYRTWFSHKLPLKIQTNLKAALLHCVNVYHQMLC